MRCVFLTADMFGRLHAVTLSDSTHEGSVINGSVVTETEINEGIKK